MNDLFGLMMMNPMIRRKIGRRMWDADGMEKRNRIDYLDKDRIFMLCSIMYVRSDITDIPSLVILIYIYVLLIPH